MNIWNPQNRYLLWEMIKKDIRQKDNDPPAEGEYTFEMGQASVPLPVYEIIYKKNLMHN